MLLSYFIGALAVLVTIVLALGFFAKADPKKLAKAIRYIGGISLMIVAALLAARGLIVYAAPLAFFGYALLQGRFSFPSFPGGAPKSPGQQSRVRTDFIEMRLDHDTGEMEGLILKGRFANRMLADLALEEALELMSECISSDGQAAQLLEAWLDRAHPDWRDKVGEAHQNQQAGSAAEAPMSVDEAYEILGLERGASDAAIRKAHRMLMKKLHPDQGGSNYLASKINEAKDLLLAGKG